MPDRVPSGHLTRMLAVGVHHSPDGRRAWGQPQRLRRKLAERPFVAVSRRSERLAPDDLSVGNKLAEQHALAWRRILAFAWRAGADHLGGGCPAAIEVPHRPLAATDRRFAGRVLCDSAQATGPVRPGDELVYQRGGWRTRPDDQRGPDAVAIHGRGGKPGDRALIKIAGGDDPGAGRTERIELGPYSLGQRRDIAAVDPDRAEVAACHFHGGLHRFGDIVG